ncbi:hypothetical protein [Serratia symbiotica]|uniref:hypothetical protein n=1 Tax=Serratia symbiotica TaxID=138074 RepID=UPI001CF0D4FF|nr:hypothetical protein [Serratia symbiotica]
MKVLKIIGASVIDGAPLMLLMIALIWVFSLGSTQVKDTDYRISQAAYAYPREIISYGLTFANTDDEVMTTIQKWKDDRWGAQIGALRVLCANDFDYVKSLGGPGTGQRICRLIK